MFVPSVCLITVLLAAPQTLAPHRYQDPSAPEPAEREQVAAVQTPAPVLETRVFDVSDLLAVPDNDEKNWVSLHSEGVVRATMSASEARRAQVDDLVREFTGTPPDFVGHKMIVTADAASLAQVERILAELHTPRPVLTVETRLIRQESAADPDQFKPVDGVRTLSDDAVQNADAIAAALQTGFNGEPLSVHNGGRESYIARYDIITDGDAPVYRGVATFITTGLSQHVTVTLDPQGTAATVEAHTEQTDVLDLGRGEAPNPDRPQIRQREFDTTLSMPVGQWVLLGSSKDDTGTMLLVMKVSAQADQK